MTLERFAGLLEALKLDASEEDILDLLWLAPRITAASDPHQVPAPEPVYDNPAIGEIRIPEPPAAESGADEPRAPARRPDHVQDVTSPLYLHLPPADEPDAAAAQPASVIRTPTASAVGNPLDLYRALRPLKRQTGSRQHKILDEEATAHQIAELGIWIPSYRPAPIRWLELALVVDGYESVTVWKDTISELRMLLQGMGVFSDVRFWTLDQDVGDPSWIGVRRMSADSPLRNSGELMDPTGRRVILVVSDCLGPAWRSGAVQKMLGGWASGAPVAIVQLLPQRLWGYTNAPAVPAKLQAVRAGVPYRQLTCRVSESFADYQRKKAVPIPVLELDPGWLTSWGRLVTAVGSSAVDGMVVFADPDATPGIGTSADADSSEDGTESAESPSVSAAEDLLQRFRASSSPEAFQLAVYLSAAPVSLPVIQLVQEVMLDSPKQAHVAEVFLGGLLYRLGKQDESDLDLVQYDFLPGVRDLLFRHVRRDDALLVLEKVSDYIGVHFGQARDFRALLAGIDMSGGFLVDPGSRPFAYVAEHVLRTLGGRYARVADTLSAALPDGAATRHGDGITRQGQPGEGSAVSTPVSPAAGTTGQTPVSPAAEVDQPEIFRRDSAEAAASRADFAERLSGVALPALRTRQRPLVCPYCYEAFGERDILFRCTGRTRLGGASCPTRQDEVFARKMGQSAKLPPVFRATGRKDEDTCPTCKQSTRTQVCPSCHSRLPTSFRSVQGRLIALVGPSDAGKTAFMTVLIRELRHGAGEQLGSVTSAADDTTHQSFVERYEWPLYTQELLPGKTIVAPEATTIAPLVFRYIKKQRTLMRATSRELLLSFMDGAGEAVMSNEKIELTANYLAAADAVIVMLDPLQLDLVRQRLPRSIPLPPRVKAHEQPSAALRRITQLMLAGSNRPTVKKPVAIALTKLDMLRTLLPDHSVLRRPSGKAAVFDSTEGAEVHAEVSSLLREWGAADLDLIVREQYLRSHYFALSALGDMPAAHGRAPRRGIRPHRVLDPFMWLLSQFGFD